MKTALILLLSCATFSLAQDMKIAPPKQAPTPEQLAPQSPAAPAPDAQVLKRLASVTWDLNTHKLVWVVEQGVEVNGEFAPQAAERYEVSPSEASMAVNDETRGIAGEEASSLHDLLGVLSLYCVESTVWWENGGDDSASPAVNPDAAPAAAGEKIGNEKSVAPAGPNAKPARGDGPDKNQPDKKPAVRLLPGVLIAANGVSK